MNFRTFPKLCSSTAVLRFIFALSIWALAFTAEAQLIPMVAAAPQMLVQRGQSADLLLTGQHLGNVNTLAVSHARGLRIELVEPANGAKADDRQLRLHLTADADAVLGERELRLISPTGVSQPLRITVGQYPQLLELEPNNTPEQAQDISFPVTLVGKIETAGDVDCFHFNAVKGQKLVFDVHAAGAGSQLDPVISIHNEAGREVVLQVDLHGSDPTAILDVPADGKYLLTVRDLQYRGGGDFTYRVDCGARFPTCSPYYR